MAVFVDDLPTEPVTAITNGRSRRTTLAACEPIQRSNQPSMVMQAC